MPAPTNQSDIVCVDIALDVPLRQCFSYLYAHDLPQIGARVWVPFGKRKMLGVVVAHRQVLPAGIALKNIISVIDQEPLFSPRLIKLLDWTAKYYHHPLGEVWHTAMPGVLRKGRPSQHGLAQKTYAVKNLPDEWIAQTKRAPVQQKVLQFIASQKAPCVHGELVEHLPNAHSAIRALLNKDWIEQQLTIPGLAQRPVGDKPNKLTSEQVQALSDLDIQTGQYSCNVVEGVTGSGKTEIYFTLIDKILERGEQALVLLPEIALTDQLYARFTQRFGHRVAALHSGMNDAARYRIWWQASQAQADIVLTTRSGTFVECKRLGLIIMDEEHDLSYKQHEGLRYHARSVAIKRAQLEDIPIVLGSATPSLETLFNIQSGRYRSTQLHKRVGKSVLPQIDFVDINAQPVEGGFSPPVVKAIAQALKQGQQILVFINRRGYAPVLYCPVCQWTAQCKRCDAQMTSHHQTRLQCHHCGAARHIPNHCDACGEAGLIYLGEGTQKVEHTLAALFPKARIQRFDRDELATSNKLQKALQKVHDKQVDILVGTQLLSKGHDFSAVNLVVVVNADQGLYSIDFRAPEQLVQQLIQVAGRAGRSAQMGRVLIQTNLPNHPALIAVKQHQYRHFANAELAQRRLAQFPPYQHIALWRARARGADQVMQFLQSLAAKGRACQPEETFCYDPVPSPMFKRGGQYHAQLLVSAARRRWLHQWLADWIVEIETQKAYGIKWSIDIDPMMLV